MTCSTVQRSRRGARAGTAKRLSRRLQGPGHVLRTVGVEHARTRAEQSIEGPLARRDLQVLRVDVIHRLEQLAAIVERQSGKRRAGAGIEQEVGVIELVVVGVVHVA